jgi:glycosyltransferase involved in cell wall biosynthesis
MKKLVVLSAYAPFPPKDGGTERSAAIIGNLSQHTEVEIFWPSINNVNSKAVINESLIQMASGETFITSFALMLLRKVLGPHSWSISFHCLHLLFPQTKNRVKRSLNSESICYLNQPWLVDFIPKKYEGEILYDAHNIETELIESMAKDATNSFQEYRLKIIRNITQKIENKACKTALTISGVTAHDLNRIGKISHKNNLYLVPNGADAQNRWKMNSTKKCLFIGSAHQPNIEAAQWLLDLASELLDHEFHIVGECGKMLSTKLPNVTLHGRISEEELDDLFVSSELFINPVITGSGMHLKKVKAMSYGIPIISTKFAARGTSLIHEESALIAERTELKKQIRRLTRDNTLKKKLSQGAFTEFKEFYSWDKIIAKFIIDLKFAEHENNYIMLSTFQNKIQYITPDTLTNKLNISLNTFLKKIMVSVRSFNQGFFPGKKV